MTNSIKNNKRIFSLLLSILLNSSLYAITFRNEPLSNFIKEGQVLHATFPENSFVMLEIASDNFDIQEGNIEKLDNLEEIFQEATANRSGCSIRSKICNLSSNILSANSSYYAGLEYINIQAKTSLHFIHCFFESPFISLGGKKMNFIDSFLINPKVLNINLNSSESDYDIIQIIFYDQSEKPTVITGEIDLTNNQTTKTLIISNVKEIEMQFKSNKKVPQKNSILEEKTVANSDLEDKTIANSHSEPSYTNIQSTHNYFQKIIAYSKKYVSAVIARVVFFLS